MKKFVVNTLIVALFFTNTGYGKLSAYFAYAVFDQPGKTPYIETYLDIAGTSAKLLPNESGKFQSKIEVQLIFSKAGKIVHFDKYNLIGPVADSSNQMIPDFIDQQRTSLDTGTYELELNISDKNTTDPSFNSKQNIRIDFPNDQVSISDIEILESYTPTTSPGKFTKSGHDLVPYILGYYPSGFNSIKFYSEIYRAKSVLNENYLIRYFITNDNNKQVLNDFALTRKQSPEEISVLMAEIPIDKLPTGNYRLTVEVVNKSNKMLAYKQSFFQRSNSTITPMSAEEMMFIDVNNTFVSRISDKDTLTDFIACLYPISSSMEVQFADNTIHNRDVHSMQQYIYYFWTKRDPLQPESAWNQYWGEVLKVNQSFRTNNSKGYETDRGRVYLQYGPPNTITTDEMDPDSYPYEIWHYQQIGKQSNRKFVFYAHDRSSNEYQLIHSDALGELQDAAWDLKLHSRSQGVTNIDEEHPDDIFGSKTKENYKLPK